MVDLLPAITVVADDPFNSSPTDPKLMGPDALRRHRAGERLPAVQMPTPLVRAWLPPHPPMLASSVAFWLPTMTMLTPLPPPPPPPPPRPQNSPAVCLLLTATSAPRLPRCLLPPVLPFLAQC